MNKILIINGPNINLLGFRETHIYGNKTLTYLHKITNKIFKKLGKISFYQSNDENKIIKKILSVKNNISGIIINPAAYSYYSIAILDSILSINKPFIEVHITNIKNRDKIRKKSIFSKYANGIIIGMGIYGYIYAIHNLIKIINKNK